MIVTSKVIYNFSNVNYYHHPVRMACRILAASNPQRGLPLYQNRLTLQDQKTGLSFPVVPPMKTDTSIYELHSLCLPAAAYAL